MYKPGPSTNGFILFSVDTTAPFDYQTTATYGCDEGYGLSSTASVRTCVGSSQGLGEWSGIAPTCEGTYVHAWVQLYTT